MAGKVLPMFASNNKLLHTFNFVFDAPQHPVEYRCEKCWSCTGCKAHDTTEAVSLREHQEEWYIKQSVTLNKIDKKFTAKLPLMCDPNKLLAPNEKEARGRLKQLLTKLKGKDKQKAAIGQEFDKLVRLGKITKLADMDCMDQQRINKKQKYFIPWSVVTKETSVSTPDRIVFDASSTTRTGRSLNSILAKGAVRLNFDQVVMAFIADKVGLVGDLSKFYMSADLDKEHHHLQCILWEPTFDPEKKASVYVMTSVTFGIKSSSRQLEYMIELVAEDNKEHPMLYNLLTIRRFVDDFY